MDYSPLAERIAGEGAAAWDIHFQAVEARQRGEDVILLSVGDPDLDTPAPIVERACQAMRDGDTHYTSLIGEPRLRRAIAQNFRAQGGWDAGPDNVCVVAGAQSALYFTAMLTLRPGDEVLVLKPSYVTYDSTIRATGAEPVGVPPAAGGRFRPDPAAVEAAVTERTRALLITNPNNPTGATMTADELAALAEIARRHDLWVYSDEVYAALTFEAEHRCIAALPGMAERTVTLSSVSKSHAMTGWRSGWLIGPEPLVQHAARLALCVVYGLPGFTQKATITALEHGAEITEQMREIFRRRRDRAVDHLDGVPGLRTIVPEAGMFLMVDVTDTGLDGQALAWRLFREQGVAVLDGSAFGPGGAGHIRISYTMGEAELERGCDRIAALCRQIAAERAPERRHA
jgi:aspartate/methionine/tyrosine aminotransferase